LDAGSTRRKASTYTGQYNTEKRAHTSMRAGFEPTIPVFGRSKIVCASDGAAIGTGLLPLPLPPLLLLLLLLLLEEFITYVQILLTLNLLTTKQNKTKPHTLSVAMVMTCLYTQVRISNSSCSLVNTTKLKTKCSTHADVTFLCYILLLQST
jgi:hypothetical protein